MISLSIKELNQLLPILQGKTVFTFVYLLWLRTTPVRMTSLEESLNS